MFVIIVGNRASSLLRGMRGAGQRKKESKSSTEMVR